MPLKKLTNLERQQININIKNLKEKKEYLSKILNERKLLLELLVGELILLKEKYNVKRKTKILRNINQDNETATINKEILEEHIKKN